MFRPDVKAVADAAASLGWEGVPVGIRMCGSDAWAIASLAPSPAVGASGGLPVAIAGVLVVGDARSKPTERASVFAGYCPRAILVPSGRDVLSMQMDAAVLDQGVVVAAKTGTRKLSDAGPTVANPTGVDASAQQEFAERVYSSLLAARSSADDQGL